MTVSVLITFLFYNLTQLFSLQEILLPSFFCPSSPSLNLFMKLCLTNTEWIEWQKDVCAGVCWSHSSNWVDLFSSFVSLNHLLHHHLHNPFLYPLSLWFLPLILILFSLPSFISSHDFLPSLTHHDFKKKRRMKKKRGSKWVGNFFSFLSLITSFAASFIFNPSFIINTSSAQMISDWTGGWEEESYCCYWIIPSQARNNTFVHLFLHF